MVPDAPAPDATSDKILSGYEAFDINGHRIVGSMPKFDTITVTGTKNQAGTQMSYGVSNFQAGYVSAVTPATVNIYQGELDAQKGVIMATMGKTANNNAWLLTIGKSNDTTYDGSSIAYKLNTSGTFADQNIAVSVPAGSAKTPTDSGASTSTSLSGTTLTVQRSVTPTVTAG